MPVPGIISAGPCRLYELANCVLMLAAKLVFIIFFHLLVLLCSSFGVFVWYHLCQKFHFLWFPPKPSICDISDTSRDCSRNVFHSSLFFPDRFWRFWSCNFLACIGKFVTCYSSPNFLCSSFGVVNRIVLCTFLQRYAGIVINRAAHDLLSHCTFDRRILSHSELCDNPQF